MITTPDRTAPRGTVEFHTWRGGALTHASARRQLWREHHGHSSRWLRTQLRMHEYHLTPEVSAMRGAHLAGVSRWYVRMITSELARRVTLTRMTPAQLDHAAGCPRCEFKRSGEVIMCRRVK